MDGTNVQEYTNVSTVSETAGTSFQQHPNGYISLIAYQEYV